MCENCVLSPVSNVNTIHLSFQTKVRSKKDLNSKKNNFKGGVDNNFGGKKQYILRTVDEE